MNFDLGHNFRKISIWVEIFENSLFWSKFSKNLDYGRNFRKILILVEIFENRDVGRDFRKISI